jgi:hypothetical protein
MAKPLNLKVIECATLNLMEFHNQTEKTLRLKAQSALLRCARLCDRKLNVLTLQEAEPIRENNGQLL